MKPFRTLILPSPQTFWALRIAGRTLDGNCCKRSLVKFDHPPRDGNELRAIALVDAAKNATTIRRARILMASSSKDQNSCPFFVSNMSCQALILI
jgi:hypothetical protein